MLNLESPTNLNMPHPRLHTLWEQLWLRYSDDAELGAQFWNEIKDAYQGPKRHYHNLDHIQAMCDLAFEHRNEIEDLDSLLFSIFYHDIIYKATSSENEEQSAQVAKARLLEMGYPIELCVKVTEQIKATKAHQASPDSDTNFLLDFDLSILGQTAKVYSQYLQAIRKEYSFYPDFLYRRGRKKVLKHFLEQEEIYKTPVFQDRFEFDARHNLKKELKTL